MFSQKGSLVNTLLWK